LRTRGYTRKIRRCSRNIKGWAGMTRKLAAKAISLAGSTSYWPGKTGKRTGVALKTTEKMCSAGTFSEEARRTSTSDFNTLVTHIVTDDAATAQRTPWHSVLFQTQNLLFYRRKFLQLVSCAVIGQRVTKDVVRTAVHFRGTRVASFICRLVRILVCKRTNIGRWQERPCDRTWK